MRVLKAKVSGGDNNWHVAVHYAVYCNEAPVPADVVVEIGSGLKRTFSAPSGAATAQIGGLTADPTGGTVTVTAVDQAGNEHSESHKIEP